MSRKRKKKAQQPVIVGFLCPKHQRLEINPEDCNEHRKKENKDHFVYIKILEPTQEQKDKIYNQIMRQCQTCDNRGFALCSCGGKEHPIYGKCSLCGGTGRVPCPDCEGKL